jgi:hypothetical protein
MQECLGVAMLTTSTMQQAKDGFCTLLTQETSIVCKRRYLTEGKSHAGIILASQQRYSIGDQMRQLLELIATKSSAEIHNNVEFLKR